MCDHVGDSLAVCDRVGDSVAMCECVGDSVAMCDPVRDSGAVVVCDRVGDSGAVAVCDIFRAGVLVILKLFFVLPKDLMNVLALYSDRILKLVQSCKDYTWNSRVPGCLFGLICFSIFSICNFQIYIQTFYDYLRLSQKYCAPLLLNTCVCLFQ